MAEVTGPRAKNDLDDAVEKITDIESTFNTVIRSFDELNLKEEINKGIYNYGFVQPSPIQARAILPLIQKRDVIAQAHSGTGKTATFVISILQNIDTTAEGRSKTQALVVAPTRELAQQIKEVFMGLANLCQATCHACVGGTAVSEDIEALRAGVSVVVGTPGRIFHMMEKGYFDTSNIKMIILDEADEMLSRGFKDQIYAIFKKIPSETQVVVVSATMSDTVLTVTDKFLNDPVKISVKKENLTLKGIKQFYIVVENRNLKVNTIIDIISQITVPQMVIFVNNQKDATILSDALNQANLAVGFIHAGLEQSKRESIMRDFRKSLLRCLVTTNLVARGIDVQGVSLVINFDLPREHESYIHRIGRSGRYGRKGVAINIIVPEEMKYMEEIVKFYQTAINEMPQDLSGVL